MKIGIAVFPTVDAPAPDRLARMIEDRGFESLWFAEHSHLPVAPDPAGRVRAARCTRGRSTRSWR